MCGVRLILDYFWCALAMFEPLVPARRLCTLPSAAGLQRTLHNSDSESPSQKFPPISKFCVGNVKDDALRSDYRLDRHLICISRTSWLGFKLLVARKVSRTDCSHFTPARKGPDHLPALYNCGLYALFFLPLLLVGRQKEDFAARSAA